jgi:hypothetical protein
MRKSTQNRRSAPIQTTSIWHTIADDSDDYINYLFEDSTNLDQDSRDTNSSLDSKSRERVSETEIKNIYRLRAG